MIYVIIDIRFPIVEYLKKSVFYNRLRPELVGSSSASQIAIAASIHSSEKSQNLNQTIYF